MNGEPLIICQSSGLTEAALICIKTSSSFGVGFSISFNSRISGEPYFVYTIAFIINTQKKYYTISAQFAIMIYQNLTMLSIEKKVKKKQFTPGIYYPNFLTSVSQTTLLLIIIYVEQFLLSISLVLSFFARYLFYVFVLPVVYLSSLGLRQIKV
jgi:hypothetical protein